MHDGWVNIPLWIKVGEYLPAINPSSLRNPHVRKGNPCRKFHWLRHRRGVGHELGCSTGWNQDLHSIDLFAEIVANSIDLTAKCGFAIEIAHQCRQLSCALF